jgi:hypothetical protein
VEFVLTEIWGTIALMCKQISASCHEIMFGGESIVFPGVNQRGNPPGSEAKGPVKHISRMPLMVCTDGMRDAMRTVLAMDIPQDEKNLLVMQTEKHMHAVSAWICTKFSGQDAT